MATFSKWTPFGVALDITATSGTVTRTSATQFTVVINASWEVYYEGAKTNYGMTASSGGVTKTISAFDGTKRSSGSGSFTGTYSISGNGSASKTITVTFKNFNTDNNHSDSKSVSFNVTVPAWTSYAVKYNANGGSGAPGNQTKWKDQTLTLSSTKPTRTGYTFQGWGTSASDTTVDYKAGASYTANAAITLYAIWKANTYTVSYNANGGSGAPGNQTKTYGATLTLSKTIPIRSKYNFKGWGTSASDTTVDYNPGGSYIANAAITLYAIWESAYVNPTINNLSIKRCDAFGAVSDDGTCILVNFDWTTYQSVTSIKISWVIDGVEDFDTIAATGTSGVVTNQIMGQNSGQGAIFGKFDPEVSYEINVTVTDGGGSTTRTVKLNTQEFPIDVLAEGKGIAFGKAAESEGIADFGFKMSSAHGELTTCPIELMTDDDLNNLLTPGHYVISNTTISKTIKNKPLWHDDETVTITASIYVNSGGDTGQIFQRFFACSKTEQFIFQRVYYQNAWGEWMIVGGCTTWQKLTLESGFSVYSTGADPKYRVNGNTVTVTGIVKPTATVTSGTTGVKFAGVIPSKFRPAVDCQFICQGSGINRWVLSVDNDGYLYVSRYGTNAYTDITSGAWLPFTVSYSI